MRERSWVRCLSITVGALCCATAMARTAITDVRVLSLQQEELLAAQTVIVAGETIVAVLPAEAYAPRVGDTIVPGAGRVLMPGLIDAHVHIDHPQDLEIYALYGITTVINMRGVPSHLALQRRVRAGEVVAPDFLTAGDYIDGKPPHMLPMSTVRDVASARELVRRHHAAGFDFIKVYSELTRDQYRAICETARSLDFAVLGHVPDAVTFDDVVACPHRNVAHGEQLFKLLDSREDEAEIRSMNAALAEAGLTFTGNIALHRATGRMPADLASLLARPEARLLHPATFQPFRSGFNRYARRDAGWVGRVNKAADDVSLVARLAAPTHEEIMVAGTDSPVAGAYPGASLIAELEAYQAAGLSPLESLRTATTHAAALVRAIDDGYGTVGAIAPGARADLVLLDASPLDDLTVLHRPSGVMLRGNWLDGSELAQRREALMQRNHEVQTVMFELEQDLFGGDLEAARARFDEAREAIPDAVLFAQYPLFFYGFRFLYGDDGLTTDPEAAGKAVAIYRMYRDTYPGYHSSHHVLGLALEAARQPEAARAAQEQALRLNPTYWPAQEALARLGGDAAP
ncbi:MAG: amidohydrolase family protein [Pseudomonadota bacterium]